MKQYKVRVGFEYQSDSKIEPIVTGYTAEWDKEHLHKVIGRYTVDFGSPIDMENPAEGLTEFEFFRRFPNGKINITMVFWPLNGKKDIITQGAKRPTLEERRAVLVDKPVVEPDEPPSDKMKVLIDSGYLTKNYS